MESNSHIINDCDNDSDGVRRSGRERGRVDKVLVHLTTVKDIKAGEELTVSYLSQLCTSASTRTEVLRQAFLFNCYCERCREEGVDADGKIKIQSGVEGDDKGEGTVENECERKNESESVGGEGKGGGGGGNVNLSTSHSAPSPSPTLTSTTLPLPSPSYATMKGTKNEKNNYTINCKLRTLLERTMSHVSEEKDLEPSRGTTSAGKNRLRNDEPEHTQIDQLIQLLSLAETFYENIITVRTTQKDVRALSNDVYSIHDSGMLVLRTALSIRKNKSLHTSSSIKENKEGGKGTDLGSDSIQAEELVVRGARLVTGSWNLIGCQVIPLIVWLHVHSFVHLIIHSFIYSLIHSFIYSFIHTYIRHIM